MPQTADIAHEAASQDARVREARWAEAMRAARRGDQTRYRQLLTEIADLLRRGARARLGRLGLSPDDAEDLVQDALIAIHAKRGTWEEDRPIIPWIRAIARHKALDGARRLGRLRARAHARPIDDWADVLAAPAPAPEMNGAEAARLVAALPGRERGVVAALGLEGASVAAAAARFAISEGAVWVAFHRGLARLRAMAREADAARGRAS